MLFRSIGQRGLRNFTRQRAKADSTQVNFGPIDSLKVCHDSNQSCEVVVASLMQCLGTIDGKKGRQAVWSKILGTQTHRREIIICQAGRLRAIFPAKNGVLVVGRAIRMVIRALIGITRGSCTQHASRRAKLKRRQHAVKPTKSTPFLRCCLVSKQASKTELIGIPNSKPPHDQQQSSSEHVEIGRAHV